MLHKAKKTRQRGVFDHSTRELDAIDASNSKIHVAFCLTRRGVFLNFPRCFCRFCRAKNHFLYGEFSYRADRQ